MSKPAPQDLAQMIEELRETMGRAGDLLEGLQGAVQQPSTEEGRDLESLRTELDDARRDSEQLTELAIQAEQHSAKLAGLYVALHQLHSKLDPEQVQATISEIAVDLLGAERFVLLLRDLDSQDVKLCLQRGFDDALPYYFAGDDYLGGDDQIDAALEDGQLRIGTIPNSQAMAVVPMVAEHGVMGALVVFELLEHRKSSLAQDRELLDLLCVHTSSALLAAQSYSATDRKLKTLKNLMSLLPEA